MAVDGAVTAAEYQARIDAWHKRRWPDATVHKIALKLAEETGEVAEAVLKHHDPVDVMHECSDVLNVVVVLLARHGFTIDEAIEYGVTVEDRKRESFREDE